MIKFNVNKNYSFALRINIISSMLKNNFSLVDYAVFGLMLALSALIGFYYAYTDRKKTSTDEFLLGGRNQRVRINFW